MTCRFPSRSHHILPRATCLFYYPGLDYLTTANMPRPNTEQPAFPFVSISCPPGKCFLHRDHALSMKHMWLPASVASWPLHMQVALDWVHYPFLCRGMHIYIHCVLLSGVPKINMPKEIRNGWKDDTSKKRYLLHGEGCGSSPNRFDQGQCLICRQPAKPSWRCEITQHPVLLPWFLDNWQ